MKIRVAVIFGGESVEHEVSIISALQAINAMNKDKYEVLPVYVSKTQDMYYSEELLNIDVYKDENKLKKAVPAVSFVKDGNKVYLEYVHSSLFKKLHQEVDMCVPIMHGTSGEDGTIQGYLEMLKIPYAGCDVLGAAVGQDKVIMNSVLQNSGLPKVKWTWTYVSDATSDMSSVYDEVDKIGYPVIIKPANLGSSVGISIAHNKDELEDCIKESGQFDNKVVIEQMVQNLREINCSVLGDAYNCRASELEEVVKQAEILDFKDKYLSNGKTKGAKSQGMANASRIVPAEISNELTEKIKELAIKSFKVLGASGVCRIDFMMDYKTEEIYVNEINTIPGSLAFYLWKESNVSFSELMDELVSLAIDRQRRKEKLITSFETNILSNFQKSGTKSVKG